MALTSWFFAYNLGSGGGTRADREMAPALHPQGFISDWGSVCVRGGGWGGWGGRADLELFGQLAFLWILSLGARDRGLLPSPLADTLPRTTWRHRCLGWVTEKSHADILHHEGLCPAQAGDTNVIKSVFNWTTFLTFWLRWLSMQSFSPPVVHLQTVTL